VLLRWGVLRTLSSCTRNPRCRWTPPAGGGARLYVRPSRLAWRSSARYALAVVKGLVLP